MAFDRTDPADLAALKAEVENNLAHYGGTVDNTYPVINTLNDKDNARTPQNSTARRISGNDLLDVVTANNTNAGEYTAVITAHADAGLRQLFMDKLFAQGEEDIDPRYEQRLINSTAGIFNSTDAPNVRAGIIAEATGPMSQAEILFGDDTFISREDWIAARDS